MVKTFLGRLGVGSGIWCRFVELVGYVYIYNM